MEHGRRVDRRPPKSGTTRNSSLQIAKHRGIDTHDRNPIVCATQLYSDWFCCLTRHGRGCLQVIITTAAACVSTLQQSTQREQRKFFFYLHGAHKHDDQNPTPTTAGMEPLTKHPSAGQRNELNRATQNGFSEWMARLYAAPAWYLRRRKRLRASRTALDCARTESRRANDESLPPFCLVINRRAERESRANYNMNEVAKN